MDVDVDGMAERRPSAAHLLLDVMTGVEEISELGSASAATLATPDCSARYARNPEQSGHVKILTIPHNPGKLRREKTVRSGAGSNRRPSAFQVNRA
jgi:hypothetical protein